MLVRRCDERLFASERCRRGNNRRGLYSFLRREVAYIFPRIGLVVGPLCQKFGDVPLLHAGSITMWIALIASSFSPNITWLAATMGAMFGFGSGTIFMMLHIFINQHFEKYKGLALGIMYTGCTVSAFVFPRLLLFLASTYGFRGSMLIFGAITMHGTALTWMLKMSESNQVSDLRPKTTSAEKK
ncbi:hypothetical protein V5799_009585 [Amblyomma americanum]|uniref:Monocarboxylate transporter n=1 Tax=Amblyomma americanum TaxID=6943 RepID=A0AAQ4F9X3_AMBAM